MLTFRQKEPVSIPEGFIHEPELAEKERSSMLDAGDSSIMNAQSGNGRLYIPNKKFVRL